MHPGLPIAQACLVITVTVIFLTCTVKGQAPACLEYNEECSPINQASCCCFPHVLCLPNNANGTSCLSPLDLGHLANILAANPFFSTLTQNFRNVASTLESFIPGLSRQIPLVPFPLIPPIP